MKFGLRIVLPLIGVVALSAGCAKQDSIDYDTLEAQSLEAWMEANTSWRADAPNPDFEKTESGLYIYWIKRSTDETPIVKVNDWVRVNYTGKSLEQNVFYTRSRSVAERQGTFTRHTHYVPNFIFLAETNTTMTNGMYEALQKMKVGDMVRLYMPSALFSGSSGYEVNNIGYNGQWGLDGSIPAIIDSLTVLEIDDNPIGKENNEVADYAQKKLGLAPADSVSLGFYLRLNTPFPFKRDSVAVDSTLSFYYKTSFLDGFLVDSNIDSVQMRAWGEIINSGPQKWDMTVTSSSDTGYFNGTEALKTACSGACYGDKLSFVVTSAYAYGQGGSAGTYSESSSSSSSSSLSDYYNMLNYYSYMNNMYNYGSYGYGYGYNYNNYYNYNSLYNSGYSSSSSSSSTEEDETTKVTITTDVLPFTPLFYEVWVVPNDGSGDTPDSNTE